VNALGRERERRKGKKKKHTEKDKSFFFFLNLLKHVLLFSELHHCSGCFRITPVDVNSRHSQCLTNFLLGGW
jgi:hypothetical protein